jgi:hypothetical protein
MPLQKARRYLVGHRTFYRLGDDGRLVAAYREKQDAARSQDRIDAYRDRLSRNCIISKGDFRVAAGCLV